MDPFVLFYFPLAMFFAALGAVVRWIDRTVLGR